MSARWDELRACLGQRVATPVHLPEISLREAAVLVPLFERGGEPHLLFTLRPEHLRQHAGQISFPGGRRDREDETPLHAALRETDEELGIPTGRVTVLGMLDELPTVTRYRIAPFVGVIPEGFAYRPSAGEVAEIIEVPVRHLLRPDIVRIEQRTVLGKMYDVHYFQFEKHVIWGATAAILQNFLDVVSGLPAWKELQTR